MPTPPSDRELLVRIDERVEALHLDIVGDASNPGLKTRVDALEKQNSRLKGWAAGAGAVLWGIFELIHRRH